MQIFTLGGNIEPKNVEGTLLKTRKHDVVIGAYTYEFRADNRSLYLTCLRGKLQEVNYDCQSLLPWEKKRKIKNLLSHYEVNQHWQELIRDKSGNLYQSPDEMMYASWSQKSGRVSFGVMCFREEMHRIVN